MDRLRILTTGALLLLFCFAAPASALADYAPPPLYDMVTASDLVAVGTVKAISAKTYTFSVDAHIYGDPVSGDITVGRFEDWECATRWAPYKIGERLMLFADRTDRAYAHMEHVPEGDFQLRGAGVEAEMPIVGLDIFIAYHDIQQATGAKAIKQPGLAGFWGHKMPLDRWVGVIETMQRLYEVKRDFPKDKLRYRWRAIQEIRKVGTDAQFKAAMADPLVAYLVAELDKRASWLR